MNEPTAMIDKDRFHRMLRPKSIVVFGRKWVDAVVRENIKFGFTGEIWAIHPTLNELEGVKVYRTVSDLPGVPDAAFIAVNAEIANDAVKELNKIGCGGVVLFASGYSELGSKGRARQECLVKAAGNMPVIGPNCYGLVNALDKALLWPDQHGLQPVDKGVAIITQSGNIGVNLTMQRRGLPLAYLCTMGNQAQVNIADVVDVMLDDARITAIGLHIEAINDIAEFDRIARRALEMRVPIVALKTGRSEDAAKIAMSHTSSLTGSDALFDAFFDRVGIARVDTIPEFLETLKLLSIIGPLEGRSVASMSCSGGEAGIIADLIDSRIVEFPEMDPDQADRVGATLNEFVNVANPLDYHTFIWGDRARMAATFTAMQTGGYDATMLLLDWPNFAGADVTAWDAAMMALADAKDATGRPAIILASLQECLPKHAISKCLERGLAPMIGVDTCLKALDAAYFIGKKMKGEPPTALSVPLSNTGKDLIIDEWNAKQLLKSYGLCIPDASLVFNADEAVLTANRIGYPVVLKGVGAQLTHKTEMDAVALGLDSEIMIREAFDAMQQVGDRFLVEKMVSEVVAELIVGVSRDEQFGLSLMLGAGGVLVEILDDNATLLFPTNRTEVETCLKGLKTYKLIEGYRGKPAGDFVALVNAVMAIANYVEANKECLQELDVNPMIICPEGQGVVAVDALIHIAEKG